MGFLSSLVIRKMRDKCLVISLVIFVCGGAALAQPRTQPTRPALWQTDWKTYVLELGKDLQEGIDPSDDLRFNGKVVEFQGTLSELFDPSKPDAHAQLEMEPQQVTVMLKLFPGVDAEKAGDKTGNVILKVLFVKPLESNREAWKALPVGAKVRFRGTLDEDTVNLVTTSDIGGLVLLYLKGGEILPVK
jgi:hypothetical protein